MKRTGRILATTMFMAGLGAGERVQAQYSDLRITEVMSSSGTGGTVDWFEVTNYGITTVLITGWTMDDNSFNYANSVALNGITSLLPGESVLFLESAGGADLEAFRTFWGGVEMVQIGYYSGSGVGFSASGDGLVLFDSGGVEATPRVEFGAAATGSSFYYAYDANGHPATSPNTDDILSTVGLLDGQLTYVSSDTLGNIGSPGTATHAVPEPGTGALLGLGAAGLLRGLRRRTGTRP